VDFEDVIPKNDLLAYEKGGFGKRMGFGKRPCVIVIDMTYGFVDPANRLAHGDLAIRAVKDVAVLLNRAREKRLPIIYTTGLNSISNLVSPGISRKVVVHPDPNDNEIVSEIKPHEGDVILAKGKASIFFGTPMLSILNHYGVDTLIVTGVTTSGCVRASVVEAASYDYFVAVPEECVADRAVVPHRVNLFDMDMKYADVVPLSEVLRYLESL
jgi:nicotinamidase-related amidase